MKNFIPLLCGIAFFAGCSQVDYLELEPSTVTFKQRNNDVWMRAKAMSHSGVHYPKVNAQWSVTDDSIAKVDPRGRLIPLKSGKTELVATVGSIRSSIPVDVRFAETMKVEPKRLSLEEGGEGQEVRVRLFDYEGNELKDRTAILKSQNPDVASVGQNVVFPVKAGSASIQVRVEELSQLVEVLVTPPKTAKRK